MWGKCVLGRKMPYFGDFMGDCLETEERESGRPLRRGWGDRRHGCKSPGSSLAGSGFKDAVSTHPVSLVVKGD